MSGDIFDGQDSMQGREVLLASSGQRPGMQLSIPPCTGQPFTAKHDQVQDLSSSRLKNSVLRIPQGWGLWKRPEWSLTPKQFLCPSISRRPNLPLWARTQIHFHSTEGNMAEGSPRWAQGSMAASWAWNGDIGAGGQGLCFPCSAWGHQATVSSRSWPSNDSSPLFTMHPGGGTLSQPADSSFSLFSSLVLW